MLARLCQVEANEEVICDNLEDATYENIVHLLTIHDIQLIVYSLETLYQLSELGEVTTTHIAAIRMAVGKHYSTGIVILQTDRFQFHIMVSKLNEIHICPALLCNIIWRLQCLRNDNKVL